MGNIRHVTVEILRARVDEARRWCDYYADAARPATCLRNIALPLDIVRWARERDALGDPAVDRYALVEHVAAERSRRLAGIRSEDRGAHGRILAFCPDGNLYHGLEEGECGGYIDVRTNPPVDTWLAIVPCPAPQYLGPILLSWVPAVFLDSIHQAIQCNPEGSLLWFDDLPCPLSYSYRRRHRWFAPLRG